MRRGLIDDVVAALIKDRRVELSWAQIKLAEKANIEQSIVSLHESRKRPFSLEELLKYEKALFFEPGALLKEGARKMPAVLLQRLKDYKKTFRTEPFALLVALESEPKYVPCCVSGYTPGITENNKEWVTLQTLVRYGLVYEVDDTFKLTNLGCLLFETYGPFLETEQVEAGA